MAATRLDDALSEMQSIRGQLGRLQLATCYRSATTAASGVLALLAAIVQPTIAHSSSAPSGASALRGASAEPGAAADESGDAIAFLS